MSETDPETWAWDDPRWEYQPGKPVTQNVQHRCDEVARENSWQVNSCPGRSVYTRSLEALVVLFGEDGTVLSTTWTVFSLGPDGRGQVTNILRSRLRRPQQDVLRYAEDFDREWTATLRDPWGRAALTYAYQQAQADSMNRGGVSCCGTTSEIHNPWCGYEPRRHREKNTPIRVEVDNEAGNGGSTDGSTTGT